MQTNGGNIEFNLTREFKPLPVKMFYNKNAIATVLAVNDVLNLDGTRIKYDSDKREQCMFHIMAQCMNSMNA